MHLIFLHGVPGVGKRTIAMELANELGFPFLNFHHLATLWGPVFGYSSPTFNELRDKITQLVVEQALALPEDGIICSFTYVPSIPLENYRAYIEKAKQGGDIGLFVGLTCDDEELKQRVETPERKAQGQLSDFQLLEDSMSIFDIPELPGPSITIDTTGESAEQTVQNIIAMLPDDMKRGFSF
ncbi:MAG: AAA family ATPase [Gammaproteobacteria bacterium]|nr:AAA family ATPase [Gammaproteobacteria bacterium]